MTSSTGPDRDLESYLAALRQRFEVTGGEFPVQHCGKELRRDPGNGPIYVSNEGLQCHGGHRQEIPGRQS